MFGKKADEVCAARVKEHDFTISKEFKAVWPHIYVDDVTQKWAVIRNKNEEPVFYGFSDIIECNILEDGSTITQGRAGSSAVGGLLFGVAGAVVGSALPKKSESICTSLHVSIRVSDITNPNIDLKMFDCQTSKSSDSYRILFGYAQDVAGTFDYMMKKAAEAKESAAKAPDAADELRKFKQLLDDGVITPEDFENKKKKQLLGI